MNQNNNLNPKRTARLAGLLYTLMIPLGAFGILFVPSAILVAGDMNATIHNLTAQAGIFRLVILIALVVQITHIFIVLLLHKLLKPVNEKLSLLMVIFMFASVPIAMLNELNHFAALHLLNNPAVDPSWIGFFFDLHADGISIASFFWGLWLLPMGLLVIRSKFLPKFVGWLLLIAGVGYLVDCTLTILLPGYTGSALADIAAIPMFAELAFPLWLLFVGIKKTPLDSAQ